MTKQSIAVKVRLAWWLIPYLKTLKFFCKVFGTEPDLDKLQRIVEGAMSVETE